MVFNCLLCESETCYVSKWCENCREIKNIMNVYGYKKVNEILKRVCVRNGEQINRKIEIEKETLNKEEEENCENKELNEKIKKQINKNDKK